LITVVTTPEAILSRSCEESSFLIISQPLMVTDYSLAFRLKDDRISVFCHLVSNLLRRSVSEVEENFFSAGGQFHLVRQAFSNLHPAAAISQRLRSSLEHLDNFQAFQATRFGVCSCSDAIEKMLAFHPQWLN